MLTNINDEIVKRGRNNFAVKISELRKSHNLTKKQLAEIAGCTPRVVANWEKALSLPTIEAILRITHHFGISTDDLLSHA